MIGAYSAKPKEWKNENDENELINTFIGLIAPAGGGKGTAMDRAIETLNLRYGTDYDRAKLGGDLQVTRYLGDKSTGKKDDKTRVPGPGRLMIVNGELSEMLKKTGIDNSTLCDLLTDLWDGKQYSKQVDKEKITVNCRFGWMGGIAATEKLPGNFTNIFGKQSNFGLYSRFIFGYSALEKYKRQEWRSPNAIAKSCPLEEVEDMAAKHKAGELVVTRWLSPEAQWLYDTWNPTAPDWARLRHNLRKVALLTSSANGEDTVSKDCMNAASKGSRNSFQSVLSVG
jgi:hypothetical protein